MRYRVIPLLVLALALGAKLDERDAHEQPPLRRATPS
jgi:hypothetical protein